MLQTIMCGHVRINCTSWLVVQAIVKMSILSILKEAAFFLILNDASSQLPCILTISLTFHKNIEQINAGYLPRHVLVLTATANTFEQLSISQTHLAFHQEQLVRHSSIHGSQVATKASTID